MSHFISNAPVLFVSLLDFFKNNVFHLNVILIDTNKIKLPIINVLDLFLTFSLLDNDFIFSTSRINCRLYWHLVKWKS